MKIADLLWERIKNIGREIEALKTARFKTATTISTMTVNGSVNLPLKLVGPTRYDIISSKQAIITLTTADNTNMVSALYLRNITPSTVNDRYIFIDRLASDAGQAKFAMYVYSHNEDDFNTLSGGGSITLNYGVQGVGSSRFTISITYEDFDPWS